MSWFKDWRLKNAIHNEIKHAEKVKKQCRKLYPDWRDDEFNCGVLKYIWGVDLSCPSKQTSFYDLTDMDIMYNRETNKYLLSVDCNTSPIDKGVCAKYLEDLLSAFNKFMKTQDPFINIDIELSDLIIGDITQADTLEELYLKFRIFVEGYKRVYAKKSQKNSKKD